MGWGRWSGASGRQLALVVAVTKNETRFSRPRVQGRRRALAAAEPRETPRGAVPRERYFWREFAGRGREIARCEVKTQKCARERGRARSPRDMNAARASSADIERIAPEERARGRRVRVRLWTGSALTTQIILNRGEARFFASSFFPLVPWVHVQLVQVVGRQQVKVLSHNAIFSRREQITAHAQRRGRTRRRPKEDPRALGAVMPTNA